MAWLMVGVNEGINGGDYWRGLMERVNGGVNGGG